VDGSIVAWLVIRGESDEEDDEEEEEEEEDREESEEAEESEKGSKGEEKETGFASEGEATEALLPRETLLSDSRSSIEKMSFESWRGRERDSEDDDKDDPIVCDSVAAVAAVVAWPSSVTRTSGTGGAKGGEEKRDWPCAPARSAPKKHSVDAALIMLPYGLPATDALLTRVTGDARGSSATAAVLLFFFFFFGSFSVVFSLPSASFSLSFLLLRCDLAESGSEDASGDASTGSSPISSAVAARFSGLCVRVAVLDISHALLLAACCCVLCCALSVVLCCVVL